MSRHKVMPRSESINASKVHVGFLDRPIFHSIPCPSGAYFSLSIGHPNRHVQGSLFLVLPHRILSLFSLVITHLVLNASSTPHVRLYARRRRIRTIGHTPDPSGSWDTLETGQTRISIVPKTLAHTTCSSRLSIQSSQSSCRHFSKLLRPPRPRSSSTASRPCPSGDPRLAGRQDEVLLPPCEESRRTEHPAWKSTGPVPGDQCEAQEEGGGRR